MPHASSATLLNGTDPSIDMVPDRDILARIERVRAALHDTEADALLVTDATNVRYLSGFTSPEDGRILITQQGALLVTDARYATQAPDESSIEVQITRDAFALVAERVGAGALAFEAEHLTVARLGELREKLGSEPIATRGIVEGLRRVKSAVEVELVRKAARITDEALAEVLPRVRAGVRESEIALELERAFRERGASAAFPTIVASGVRGALPHGEASDKTIEQGDLVTIDLGARYRGYCADMTRTIAVGEPSERMREVYAAVLEAQEAALDAVRPGVSGKELDAVARKVLETRGLAVAFVHALGHGVGLNVHEAPSLSPRSDDILEPGMLVTIEPGAYLPGVGGVRIEDLVLVTDEGCEALSKSPHAARTITGS